VELKMKTEFVANGFERWKQAQDANFRKTIRAEAAGKSQTLSFPEKIRLWLKTESACLRGKRSEDKSSPKILW
jgi:hypothetical protein